MKWRHQEEVTKKKDPEPRRAPIRRPGDAPVGESTPKDPSFAKEKTTTDFHPHWGEHKSTRSKSDVESDDDPDQSAGSGRIHEVQSGDAALMRATDILDLRKNYNYYCSPENINSASSAGNDDDYADDDVTGVSMT